MKNTVTNADGVVYVWINNNSGKCFFATNANTSKDSDWIYKHLVRYEYFMKIGGTKARTMPPELLSDLQQGDTFRSMIITFNDKYEALDYSNQVVNILKDLGLTYSKNIKVLRSVEQDKNRVAQDFEILDKLSDELSSTNLNSYDIENAIYKLLPDEASIDTFNREISVDNNAYTNKKTKKVEKPKEYNYYCPICGYSLDRQMRCQGSLKCVNYEEVVENPSIKEVRS